MNELLPPNADTEGYGRPVTTALLISLSAVEAADTTRLARPLLELIALMDPLGHPAGLWITQPVRKHLRASRPGRRRWLRRQQPAVTEQDIEGALDCLRTYALIAQDAAQAPIRVHALTARAIRETIPPRVLPVIARTAADAILSLWPDVDPPITPTPSPPATISLMPAGLLKPYSNRVPQPQRPTGTKGALQKTVRSQNDRLRLTRTELRIRGLQVRILPSAHS